MASSIDICNLALAQIGQQVVISDLEEQSVEAEYCALFWPIVRDEAVASHAWSFATERVTLADVSSSYPPPADFEYSYGWPSECLRFIGVRGAESTDDLVNETNRVGASGGVRLIFTDIADAVGVYVKRVENATLFPPLLTRALEFMLAARLATPIVKGSEGLRLSDGLRQRGEYFLSEAKAADANQDQLRRVRRSDVYQSSSHVARGGRSDTAAKIIRDV